MIITRKRLRDKGYVLVSASRADSINDLRIELRDTRTRYVSAVKRRLSEQDTGRPTQFDLDILDAKYQSALRRITELEDRP